MSDRLRRLLVLAALVYLVTGTIALVLRLIGGDIDVGTLFLVGNIVICRLCCLDLPGAGRRLDVLSLRRPGHTLRQRPGQGIPPPAPGRTPLAA